MNQPNLFCSIQTVLRNCHNIHRLYLTFLLFRARNICNFLKSVIFLPNTCTELPYLSITLGPFQYISDTRYYTVRYTTFSSASSSSPRYRYVNATDVTCLIDNLKPSTVYEFAVKTIKVRLHCWELSSLLW